MEKHHRKPPIEWIPRVVLRTSIHPSILSIHLSIIELTTHQPTQGLRILPGRCKTLSVPLTTRQPISPRLFLCLDHIFLPPSTARPVFPPPPRNLRTPEPSAASPACSSSSLCHPPSSPLPSSSHSLTSSSCPPPPPPLNLPLRLRPRLLQLLPTFFLPPRCFPQLPVGLDTLPPRRSRGCKRPSIASLGHA